MDFRSLKSMKNVNYNYKAFTLIELLVTIAIIAILASLAIAGYQTYKSHSYDSQAIMQAASARTAFETFLADYSAVPEIQGSAIEILFLSQVDHSDPAWVDGSLSGDFSTYASENGFGAPDPSTIHIYMPGFQHQVGVGIYLQGSAEDYQLFANHCRGSSAEDEIPTPSSADYTKVFGTFGSSGDPEPGKIRRLPYTASSQNGRGCPPGF